MLGCFVPCLAAQNNGRRDNKPILEAKTAWVEIPTIVLDPQGKLVTDLTANDFLILDGGAEQKITYFSNFREPASVVLLLDESGSMVPKIPFVRAAVRAILRPFPDAEEQDKFPDEFCIMLFARWTKVAAPFARGADLGPLTDGMIMPTDDFTALFDALHEAVGTGQKTALNTRRAVILITDGDDNISHHTLLETKRFLQEADMTLFAVMAKGPFRFFGEVTGGRLKPPSLLRDPDTIIGPAEQRGPHNLKVLTEATGGAVFSARHPGDLSRIVRTLGIAIRFSYLIAYEPPHRESAVCPKDSTAGWHKLKVQLVPAEKYRGYTVYARHEYCEDPGEP